MFVNYDIKNDMIFKLISCPLPKIELLIPQGSAGMFLRCGGKYYVCCLEFNFPISCERIYKID